MMKKGIAEPQEMALNSEILGQDGAYLARLLLETGSRAYGASRDAQFNPFDNLKALRIRVDI